MSHTNSVVAIFESHAQAEKAILELQKSGFDMKKLSIVGRDFQTVEKPLGFVTTGTVANEGARFGAWTGGIFGLLVGAAFLIVPGFGPLIIVGPFAATLLGGIEGALAGGTVGGLAGALIGLGVSKNQAIRYESQIKAGKFLVMQKGDATQVQKAKTILGVTSTETPEVVETLAV
jgi:hypothetical protein